MEATMSDLFPGFEQRQIETSGATIKRWSRRPWSP